MTVFEPRDCEFVLQQLHVSPGMEQRRREFAEAAVRAFAIVTRFASRLGWDHLVDRPLYTRFEVVPDQAELVSRVQQHAGEPEPVPLPTGGLAAALVDGYLIVVTPEEYMRVRPEYASQPDAWARLLAHELIHVLHERAVGSDDEAMGPKWFFEGLAVLGSEQDLGQRPRFSSAAEALATVKDDSRGSYARYENAVGYFAERVPLKELVSRARNGDFEDWLATLDWNLKG